jgi:N-methylhydantoinase B
VRWGTPHAEVVRHTANFVRHEAGEAFEYQYGGGGGWGDPLERDPQKVLGDVLDEYVSLEGARRDYGVVLAGSLADYDLRVDEEATGALRAELRARRG